MESKLTINKNKSGLLWLGKNRLFEEGEYEGYKIVKEYKYLGILLDKELTFEKHTDNIIRITSQRLKKLKILKAKKISDWHMLYLWMIHIVSIYRYGALIYCKHSNGEISK